MIRRCCRTFALSVVGWLACWLFVEWMRGDARKYVEYPLTYILFSAVGGAFAVLSALLWDVPDRRVREWVAFALLGWAGAFSGMSLARLCLA